MQTCTHFPGRWRVTTCREPQFWVIKLGSSLLQFFLFLNSSLIIGNKVNLISILATLQLLPLMLISLDFALISLNRHKMFIGLKTDHGLAFNSAEWQLQQNEFAMVIIGFISASVDPDTDPIYLTFNAPGTCSIDKPARSTRLATGSPTFTLTCYISATIITNIRCGL